MRKLLFRVRYRKDIKRLNACPCGTRGHCMACAGIAEWLTVQWEEWQGIHHCKRCLCKLHLASALELCYQCFAESMPGYCAHCNYHIGDHMGPGKRCPNGSGNTYKGYNTERAERSNSSSALQKKTARLR